MNTTGKVLLAVGGIVLAGMVAYVLLPGPKTAPEETDLAEAMRTTEVAEEVATQPATLPATQPDPFAAPATEPALGRTVLGDPALADNADQRDPWNVLDQGRSRTAVTLGQDASATLGGEAESSSAVSTPKTWKVAAGDTLAGISTKVYGSAKYASRIAAANPKVNTKRLRTGQVLSLPEIAPQPTLSGAANATGTDDSAASALSGRTYKVVAGDSLRKIAQKTLGSQAMWGKIYELNKKVIGPDPAKLRQGIVLQLPEAGSR